MTFVELTDGIRVRGLVLVAAPVGMGFALVGSKDGDWEAFLDAAGPVIQENYVLIGLLARVGEARN